MLGNDDFDLDDLPRYTEFPGRWVYDWDLDEEVHVLDPIDEKKNEVAGALRDLEYNKKEIAWRKRALSDYLKDMQSIGLDSNLVKSNPRKGKSVLGALILGGIIGHSMKK